MDKITIPPLEADPNDGQWHGHNGGDRPEGITQGSIVDLRWTGTLVGDNDVLIEVEPVLNWPNVCAYRVTRAHVEPPKPREWWVHTQVNFAMPYSAGPQSKENYVHVQEVMTDD